MTDALHNLAWTCLDAGIEAAHPKRVLTDAVELDGSTLTVGSRPPDAVDADPTPVRYDLRDFDDLLVVGGGNAAGTAAARLDALLGEHIDDGLAVTDVSADAERIEMVAGSHPVPDETAVAATGRLRALLADADEQTLVIAVVTGGASALLAAPMDGISLADLQATTEELLASDANINEMNAVRRHVSATKGGRLAETAAPATVVTLLFSDVVGNDPAVIGSGPFAPDESSFADACAVVDRYDLDLPDAVVTLLARGAAGEVPETPGSDAPAFDHVETRLLAAGYTAASAAAEAAAARGYDPLVLSTRVRGEARESARTHVAIAEQCRGTGDPVDPPAVVVSGGETTVTLGGEVGTGGPNAEFALSAALELDDAGVVVAAVDTDGIDGAAEIAGGSVDAETVTDESTARRALATHDAATALDAFDAAVRTGPTGTNVNDLRVLVVA